MKRGFTLLEMALVLAILGVLLAVGTPSLHGLIERHRAQAAADALTQDLRNARELAVLGGVPVHLSFGGDAGHWCWGVNRGGACDCGAALNACNVSRTDGSRFAQVRLEQATGAAFESRGQTHRPGETVFATGAGDHYRVRMSLLGHARSCRQDKLC